MGEGAPDGVGICLSGGGLRAASYSLGVFQALQESRGLIYGPRSADYLAVVSGGSCIGGTLAATASELARRRDEDPTPPPLATNAPETAHVVGHGRYLIEDGFGRFAVRFGVRVAMSVGSMLGLLWWLALMIAIFERIARDVGVVPIEGTWLQAGATVVTVIAMAGIARGVLRSGGLLRFLQPLALLIVLLVSLPSFFAFGKRFAILSDPDWWFGSLGAIGWLVAGFLAALCVGVLARVLAGTIWGSILAFAATGLPDLWAFSLLSASASGSQFLVSQGQIDRQPATMVGSALADSIIRTEIRGSVLRLG